MASYATIHPMTTSNLPRIRSVDYDHLQYLIRQHMKTYGPTCNLNHIDVTEVTNMSGLFNHMGSFQGDISQWDVKNVTDMSHMFDTCQFNGDISHWNTSKVRNMRYMFCDASFDGDLTQWAFDALEDKDYMFSKFHESPFGMDCKKIFMDAKLNTGYQNIAPDIQEILMATEEIERLRDRMRARWTIYQQYQQFLKGELTDHPVNALTNDALQKALLCYQMEQHRDMVPLGEETTLPLFESV